MSSPQSPTKIKKSMAGALDGTKSTAAAFDGIVSDLHARRRTTQGGIVVAAKSNIQNEIGRRRFPNIFTQIYLLLQRGSIKYLRSFWPLRVIDILLLLTAAFIIGMHVDVNYIGQMEYFSNLPSPFYSMQATFKLRLGG